MLIWSWNVNGIRALDRKDALPWQLRPDVDVWCLQETKAHRDMIPDKLSDPAGYHSAWHSAQKRGYSGVAIFSRDEPDEVITGLGDDTYDCEGRVIAVRFGSVVIVSAYFPNSQDGGKRIDYKIGFCTAMETYLADLRKQQREVLLMGDYNIAHQPIDLARPKENEGNAGYLPEEREWMTRYLGLGYRDVWRERNPEATKQYTWWTYRGGARGRNVGWRIDYGTTTPDLGERVTDCGLHQDIHGSDHCPVSIALKV